MKKKIYFLKKILFFLSLFSLLGCPKLNIPKDPYNNGEEIIFVSSKSGLDSYSGSPQNPKKTIIHAIQMAKLLGIKEIRIAEGTYEVHFQEKSHIVMNEGISLYGGYSQDFKQRDKQIFPTIIKDISHEKGTETEPNRTIEFPSGISQDTVLDGFTVIAGSGEYNCAIYLNQASPTINNNKIYGSEYISNTAITSTSIGIYSNNSKGVQENNIFFKITNNYIYGGNSNGLSLGIYNKYSSMNSIIQNNKIDGGSVTGTNGGSLGTIGIWNLYSNVHILNNNIFAGKTDASSESNTSGITNIFSVTLIKNNLIYGGQATYSTTGISSSMNNNDRIINNVIHGGEIIGTQPYRFTRGIHTYSTNNKILNNTIITGSNGLYSIGLLMWCPDGISCSISENHFNNNIVVLSGGKNQYAIYEEVKIFNGTVNKLISLQNNAILGLTTDNSNNQYYYAKYVGDNNGNNCPNIPLESNLAKNCYNQIDDLNNPLIITGSNGYPASGNISEPDYTDYFQNNKLTYNNLDEFSEINLTLKNNASCNMKQGGLNGNENSFSFNNDLLNITRTSINNSLCTPTNTNAGGWSIGAYEF